MYPDFFHIGIPKSGTTTIQAVLDMDPRINKIAGRYFQTPGYFTEDYNHCKPNLLNIESDETIVRQDGNYSKFTETLYHICNKNPRAHIIVTIREQKSMLVSRYKYAINNGTKAGSFLKWLFSKQGMDFISIANYSMLYKSINMYFPQQQIHFLLFEEMKHDYFNFFKRLYEVLGLKMPEDIKLLKKNKGLNNNQTYILEKLNKYRIFSIPDFISKVEFSLHKKLAISLSRYLKETKDLWENDTLKVVEEEFRQSNQELIKMQVFDTATLSRYGYMI